MHYLHPAPRGPTAAASAAENFFLQYHVDGPISGAGTHCGVTAT